MRKVLFKYRKNLHTTEEREGIFHGFFICSYSDSTREVEWTAAFVEDPTTGRVHKLDTDDFRFVDSPNQGETISSNGDAPCILPFGGL